MRQDQEFRESGLRKSLSSEYKPFLDELNVKIEPILARTTNVLTQFTEHTLKHSLGIENIYDILLDDKYDLLNEIERYLLIAATLLHDIGMVGRKPELGEDGYEDARREGHHAFSKQVIIEQAMHFNFTQREAKLIADVAEAHRKVPLDTFPESMPWGIGGNVRPRLLAALLRFADELHVTEGRTSTLLIDIIQPDVASLKHHKRHLAVSGVGRKHDERDKIEIAATVQDWEMEVSLNEMIEEIRRKHGEVQEILANHKILVSSVEPLFNVEELVSKEILLLLSKDDFSIEEMFESLNHRSSLFIKKAVQALRSTNTIKLQTETGKFQLSTNEKTFRGVFNHLKGTERIIEFINSPYVSNNTGKIFDDIAFNIYSHRVVHGDRDDRLLLIKNSPSVLNSLLNEQDINPQFGQMDRSVILDLLILNGFMQDVAKEPLLSKKEEIVHAMTNIQNTLNKNIGSFLQLVQHLDTESLQQQQEAFQAQIEKKK